MERAQQSEVVAELVQVGRPLSWAKPTHNPDDHTQTLSKYTMFPNSMLFPFEQYHALNFIVPVPFYSFLSAHSIYHISSVFRVFAPRFPLRKCLNLHSHTHTPLHKTNGIINTQPSSFSYRKQETLISAS